ncbi:MAG: SsrA-binding protein SmpB [Sphingomonadales bacterium]|nr:SsrA-binding protein SmpB [Sphingomonadales bacterium]
MANTKKKAAGFKHKVVADNRKARYNYEIGDKFEAGIVLTGTEVKSLRFSSANITDSYAEVRGDELWLVNALIQELAFGNRHNHETRRPRKLLMHRREINKLGAAIQRDGMTVVPLSLYFNPEGRVKIELGLAKGKKQHDKRQTIKNRQWERDKARVLKNV